ncbi:phosphoglycerate kinase [Candidatus Micrarchaeota archaeon]|nr:phosphoglycerate kinase [Candidatus Micrarchaeota archaeon]
MNFKSIKDIDVKGRKVAIRVDLNSPLDENGKPLINKRIQKHSETIKELSERGARVIVLSHQGKKGKSDFRSLEEHISLLESLTGRKIEFSKKILGKETLEKINSMKDGDILLLENVRYLEEETEKPFDAEFVVELSTHIDFFILDALSVAHREHASVVGFTKFIPGFAGNVLREEIEALKKLDTYKGKITLIFGGAKASDSINIMEHWLVSGRAGKVLLGGCPATLFLLAAGKSIGDSREYLEKTGSLELLEKVKEIYSKYKEVIEIPSDIAVVENGERKEYSADSAFKGSIGDIGKKTAETYSRIIHGSEIVVVNGPMGIYEIPELSYGTEKILRAIADSKAFGLVGGGHTASAIEKFGIREDNFGYVSLSGKAFLQHLSGKPLPGLLALNS